MSVSEDTRPEGFAGASAAPAAAPPQRDGQFDKTPPQDIAAEQCVLGGMLLSKDAIADVVEILKSNDFYRPVHATVFDAILDLYGRGEPADADHRRRRARRLRRPEPHRRRAVPAHAHRQRADRGQRLLLRADRRRARRAAPPGRGRHPDRPARLRLGGRWRPGRGRHRRPGPAGRLRRHRAPGQRGLRGPGRHAPADARRDRGRRCLGRDDDRRPHRLHRPGPAPQRPARRPVDHRCRPSRSRQGARPGHPAADAGGLDHDG